MNEVTKALDELSRKDKARNIRAVLISLVLISSLLLAGFLFTVGDIRQVHGTTKGLFGRAGDHGEQIYLLVALEDGEQVRISLPGNVPYIKESQVIVHETTTRLFGYKRYAFLRYSTTVSSSDELINPIR